MLLVGAHYIAHQQVDGLGAICDQRQRAFSIFYTGGVGAGALAPVLYGLMSDLFSVPVMMIAIAAIVLVTLPLVWWLRPHLREV